MRALLTPKQVARAMDVSESSIKRWCDRGVIATQYTAGGHRRITLAGLQEFVRSGGRQVVHPEALGLPPTSCRATRGIARAREQFIEALVAGDEGRSRQVVIDLYLAEHAPSVIFDEVLAAAFGEIGKRWSRGDIEVYQERRGCEIALRVLYELRLLLPSPPDDAPLAIGAAPSADQYSLGTTMAELVLRDAGWNAVSLGSHLPFETLAAAITRQRPKLFWLSCSYIASEAEFLAGYQQLCGEFGRDVAFVVGGFALTERIRKSMKFASYCENMQQLASFAHALRGENST